MATSTSPACLGKQEREVDKVFGDGVQELLHLVHGVIGSEENRNWYIKSLLPPYQMINERSTERVH